MKTTTINDKHGSYYKVEYSIGGKLHTIMGGDKEALEKSAKTHIQKYTKKISKSVQQYGWA